jgi:hypothetical protein
MRMKTRVGLRVDPALGNASMPITSGTLFAGAAVIAAQADALRRVEWLLQSGAEEVLVLPQHAPSPQKVIIHWVDEAARRATLAVSASFLRHVSAEAVYVGILPETAPDAQRPQGVRALLDARSEAQAVHGLEMRTELRVGDVARELTRQWSEGSDQLLILGISDISVLREQFTALLQAAASRSLLIVYNPVETAQAVRSAANSR